jgi:hypothetical protein
MKNTTITNQPVNRLVVGSSHRIDHFLQTIDGQTSSTTFLLHLPVAVLMVDLNRKSIA